MDDRYIKECWNKISHIQPNPTEEEFVEFRQTRDKTLTAPQLLLPSIQINIDGGQMPEAEDNGSSYLKIPIRPQGSQS